MGNGVSRKIKLENVSNGLVVEWEFNDKNVAEKLIVTEYNKETYILELEEVEEEPEQNYIWVWILVSAIIVGVAGAAGFVIYKRIYFFN